MRYSLTSFIAKSQAVECFWFNKALGFRYKSKCVVISMYSVWASCNYVMQAAHFWHGFIQFITRYRQIGSTHITLTETVLYHFEEH